jgi:hypothetical protein
MTDQDQTTATTMSTLADHVVVTNTVVEQLAGHGREVPRYIADEIGQAVLALVPDAEPTELTPVQDALLDALRDVALSSEAPAAKYATEQIARLAREAFGYPVEREGGVMGFLYGRPVAPKVEVEPAGVAPVESLRRQTRATGGIVNPKHANLVGADSGPELLVPDQTAPAPWPFSPGDVVRDSGEDADHGAQIDAAPNGVVLADHVGDHWKRDGSGWWCTLNEPTSVGRLTSHDLERSWGPLTVVSVPDQEADRG